MKLSHIDIMHISFWFLEVIREKGLEKVTVDMLVTEITPKARCKFIVLYAKDFVKKIFSIKDIIAS